MENRKIIYSCQHLNSPESFTSLVKKPIIPKEQGVIRWHIANFGGNLTKSQAVLAATEAFAQWQRVFDMIKPVGRYIDIRSTENFEVADIVIFSCPENHSILRVEISDSKNYILRCPFNFDGAGGVLGHAWPIGHGLFGGHVHMDQDEDPRKHDIQTIKFHEIGHALGFGHSEVKDAIMYRQYTGIKLQPHDDDIKVVSEVWSDYKYEVSGVKRRKRCRLFG